MQASAESMFFTFIFCAFVRFQSKTKLKHNRSEQPSCCKSGEIASLLESIRLCVQTPYTHQRNHQTKLIFYLNIPRNRSFRIDAMLCLQRNFNKYTYLSLSFLNFFGAPCSTFDFRLFYRFYSHPKPIKNSNQIQTDRARIYQYVLNFSGLDEKSISTDNDNTHFDGQSPKN